MKTSKTSKPGASVPTGLEAEQRLTFNGVSALTSMGRTKLYSLIKSGDFPQPERYGKRCSRWRAGTVVDFLNGGPK